MAGTSTTELRPAHTAKDLSDFKELVEEYFACLGVDLSFQGVEEELQSLPGKYGPPGGIILLAFVEGKAAGAAAVRPLPAETATSVSSELGSASACEMKRLYVRPEYQGLGLGMALGKATLKAAKQLGYEAMYLDTLERLTAANKLYERLGFQKCASYNGNPLEDVVFWVKKDL